MVQNKDYWYDGWQCKEIPFQINLIKMYQPNHLYKNTHIKVGVFNNWFTFPQV